MNDGRLCRFGCGRLVRGYGQLARACATCLAAQRQRRGYVLGAAKAAKKVGRPPVRDLPAVEIDRIYAEALKAIRART